MSLISITSIWDSLVEFSDVRIELSPGSTDVGFKRTLIDMSNLVLSRWCKVFSFLSQRSGSNPSFAPTYSLNLCLILRFVPVIRQLRPKHLSKRSPFFLECRMEWLAISVQDWSLQCPSNSIWPIKIYLSQNSPAKCNPKLKMKTSFEVLNIICPSQEPTSIGHYHYKF